MKVRKLSSVLFLTSIFFSFSPVRANEIEKDVIKHNDKQIISYNSTDTKTATNNSAITVNANFIEDSNSSDRTTVLAIEGFIPSGRKFIYPKDNTWQASMLWPNSYATTIINDPLDSNVKITNSTPNNTIRNKEVSSSISYGFGGGISVEGKNVGGSANGNIAFTKSISYQQPDYETVQTEGNSNRVAWKTNFTETLDGYSRDSWNIIYGNQMFMKSRQNNSRENNFTSDYKLSSLITGGFSPKYGVVLKAPKDVTKSRIKVYLGRTSETYTLNWTGVNWTGANKLDQTNSDWSSNAVITYELDWNAHTLKVIA
ncbi:hypothetical protein IBQ15_002691 [Enterococcus faecalis]|nr:hypothetical protein [Enterococcus faecalis]